MGASRQDELDRRLRLYTLRLGATIEATLDDIPHAEVRRLVGRLAFAPSQELPKKKVRPDPQVVWLVEQFYRALGGPEGGLETLRRLVLAFKEAADITDDLMDGDVAPGAEVSAGAVVCALLPLSARYAAALGPRAFDVFSRRLFDLPLAVIVEKEGAPTLERYLRAVDGQAAFLVAPLEAAAAAAGAGEDGLDLAVRVGTGMYRFKQLMTDTLQKDRPGNLNITRFCSPQEVLARLRDEHRQLRAALDALPEGEGRAALELFFSVYSPL
jgi:hypothetical protein